VTRSPRRPPSRNAPARRAPSRARGLSAGRQLAVAGGSALLTLAAIVVLLVIGAMWIYHGPGPKAPNDGHTVVLLRPGAGLQEIAGTLKHEGVIGSSPLFLFAAQLSGSAKRLKAGEYDFPSHASMARVMGDIREGRIVHHMVTIPEGITAEQAVDILMKSDVLTGAAPVPAEGSILPETYEVRRGEDRSAVLQRMMEARDTLLRTLWSQRRPDLPYTTPEEAVTLASVVEKETALPSERPRIAAVFVNRLQKGMRLESDPTVIYGITRGQPLGHGLRLSELTSPSAYNTYLNDGLPPTPIGNPGRASLAAELDPPRTT